jgi:hypothetical protein
MKNPKNPKKPTAKMAKEKSKTSFSEPREVYRRSPSKEGVSMTRDPLPVAFVKKGGKKSVVSTEKIPDGTRYQGYRYSEMPTTNSTPQKGQEKMKVKTYEKGKLIMTEKQGKDLLGRPYTKRKTTGEAPFEKGVEKKTLTKKGVKTKSTY